ncbi:hypothetical protein ACWT_6173 [Actinoplanes sp. SE50]|nr:hypothetical protein ACPL_6305 [Actinoplanes sp. SE50/110]ATO85588.1 hypothetical protein ACWT_6173 [Actinoplanes sp. SE50]SLM03001.1 hypothetical protein ACSP50_6286 [Actinoplanes sp. SE50/110]
MNPLRRKAAQQPTTGPAAPASVNLTEQFAIEYAKSAVPNMLKAIDSVKRYNRATLIGALITSYLHQAHYLASTGAGYFAYLPPAIFDTAMVSMLIVVRTPGIVKDAKRWAMAVFIGAALLSATVNFAAPATSACASSSPWSSSWSSASNSSPDASAPTSPPSTNKPPNS